MINFYSDQGNANKYLRYNISSFRLQKIRSIKMSVGEKDGGEDMCIYSW